MILWIVNVDLKLQYVVYVKKAFVQIGDKWYCSMSCKDMRMCSACWKNGSHIHHLDQRHEYTWQTDLHSIWPQFSGVSCDFMYDYDKNQFKIWKCTTMYKTCKQENMHRKHDEHLKWKNLHKL